MAQLVHISMQKILNVKRTFTYKYNFIYLYTKTLIFLSFILGYLEILIFEHEMKTLITGITTCLVIP